MINKLMDSLAAAVADVKDGSTVMVGASAPPASRTNSPMR